MTKKKILIITAVIIVIALIAGTVFYLNREPEHYNFQRASRYSFGNPFAPMNILNGQWYLYQKKTDKRDTSFVRMTITENHISVIMAQNDKQTLTVNNKPEGFIGSVFYDNVVKQVKFFDDKKELKLFCSFSPKVGRFGILNCGNNQIYVRTTMATMQDFDYEKYMKSLKPKNKDYFYYEITALIFVIMSVAGGVLVYGRWKNKQNYY